jgi:hypothetical protein
VDRDQSRDADLDRVPDVQQGLPPDVQPDRVPDVGRDSVEDLALPVGSGAGPCLCRHHPDSGAREKQRRDYLPELSLPEQAHRSRLQEG